MTIRAFTLFVSSCAVFAQDAPSPAANSTPSAVAKPGVRRFSAGGVLTFSGFRLMENLSVTQANATYTTKPSGPRLAGGGIVQYAFANRYAAAGQFLLRRARFETNSTFTLSTTASSQDFSSADFWEIPLTLRRYSRPHAEQGARWFAEGGMALRYTRNIRSSLLSTDTAGRTVCCDERPIMAQHSPAAGLTLGAGYQVVDQFGLRLVPQFRYTRWLQPTFDQRSIRSRRDQIEAGVAITF
jgi:hypothetical protein